MIGTLTDVPCCGFGSLPPTRERNVPHWDDPDTHHLLIGLLRDFEAAEQLCEELAFGSRDRLTIEGKISALNDQLIRGLWLAAVVGASEPGGAGE